MTPSCPHSSAALAGATPARMGVAKRSRVVAAVVSFIFFLGELEKQRSQMGVLLSGFSFRGMRVREPSHVDKVQIDGNDDACLTKLRWFGVYAVVVCSGV